MTTPTPPRPLGEQGAAWWREVHEMWEFDASTLPLAVAIAELLDEIDRLTREVTASTSMTVSGSRGQLVEHPALDALRKHRALLGQLLRQLDLPETQDVATSVATIDLSSYKARGAALAGRYGRHSGIGH